MMGIEYRKAVLSDLRDIIAFVDYWLTGGGQKDGIPGATHDYFVRYGQQKAYLEKYNVLIAICGGLIVGWAVKTSKGVLIHLLVAATFRGKGVGGELLRRMDPEIVRSKFDQKSGDPAVFYSKQGYVKSSSERTGKKMNIDLFVKANVIKGLSAENLAASSSVISEGIKVIKPARIRFQRTIDTMRVKIGNVAKYSGKYSY